MALSRDAKEDGPADVMAVRRDDTPFGPEFAGFQRRQVDGLERRLADRAAWQLYLGTIYPMQAQRGQGP